VARIYPPRPISLALPAQPTTSPPLRRHVDPHPQPLSRSSALCARVSHFVCPCWVGPSCQHNPQPHGSRVGLLPPHCTASSSERPKIQPHKCRRLLLVTSSGRCIKLRALALPSSLRSAAVEREIEGERRRLPPPYASFGAASLAVEGRPGAWP
jgi:hypothetical protein